MKKTFTILSIIGILSISALFAQDGDGVTLTHYGFDFETLTIDWEDELSSEVVDLIEFDYGADGVGDLTDDFAIVFTGYISPIETGDYQFEMFHNDGAIFLLDTEQDGINILDPEDEVNIGDTIGAFWNEGQTSDFTDADGGYGAITLTEGEYYQFAYLIFEHINTTRGALKWKFDGDEEYISIPVDELYTEMPEDIEEPDALKNTFSHNLEVYPNPAENELTINLSNYFAVDYVRLFDVQGRMVIESNNLSAGLVNISLENISSGLYMLEVSADSQFFSTKVLVK